jgi:hypothetical protein
VTRGDKGYCTQHVHEALKQGRQAQEAGEVTLLVTAAVARRDL